MHRTPVKLPLFISISAYHIGTRMHTLTHAHHSDIHNACTQAYPAITVIGLSRYNVACRRYSYQHRAVISVSGFKYLLNTSAVYSQIMSERKSHTECPDPQENVLE